MFFRRFGSRALSVPFIKTKGVAIIRKTTDQSGTRLSCLASQKSLKALSASRRRDQLQSHWLLNDALSDELLSQALCSLAAFVRKLIKAFSHAHTFKFWTWLRILTELITPLLALKLLSVGVYGVELKWLDSFNCAIVWSQHLHKRRWCPIIYAEHLIRSSPGLHSWSALVYNLLPYTFQRS